MLGKTLAHYKILSHIGTGGMGEVYRAHDTKLDREVALKALPVEFSNDPERVARFEREATTLAKLQHANIAAIYGFDRDQDRTFLVMELVEGEDLSERLERGAIPSGEAVLLAAQIAEGLEAAHALGIVHRDLKPANIKITPTGDVKLLDFGLARAYAGEEEGSTIGEVSNTPTITAAMTMQGVILGTAAYMSPEQARGKSIDRQADIWSFGVVFFEMLTAEKLFGGETISDSIGAILHRNPDLTLLPDVPLQVTTLLRRCLAREKKERLRDIGDARLELADAAAATTTDAPETQTGSGKTSWIAMAVIAVLVVVAGWLALTRDQGAAFNNITLGIPPERAISLRVGAWTTMRYSADGQKILYAGGDEQNLYLNHIGEFEAVPVSNIDDASMYDFSPDGLWIAYFADSKLWKVAVSGGAPIELCETPDGPGLSWGQGEIFFVGSNGGGILSVPEGGGEPRQVSTLDQGREETSHRWPHVLPGGRHLLLTIKTARIATFDDALIGLLSLDTGEVEVLLTGGTQPQYSTTGHIIYGRESQLFAVPFDLKSLAIEGTPTMVLDQVYTDIGTGSVQFALNAQGGLAYIPVRQKTRGLELSWLHLTGFSERLDFSAETYYAPAISPDGKKLAGRVIAANDKIHVFDLERQTLTRLTNTPGNDDVPIWSPNGSLIAYSNDLTGNRHIYLISSDGGTPARKLVAGDANNFSNCWTPDGKRLLFNRIDEGGKGQVWIVPVDGNADPEPVLVDENSNVRSRLSPDGRWLAYLSDSSGQMNVYIRPFERPGGPVRVSIDEGFTPRWAPDGSTLYFVANDKMMAAPVSTEGGLRVGAPEELFELDEEVFGPLPISPDGEKFLANRARPESEWHFGIRVVRNWVEGLEDLGK